MALETKIDYWTNRWLENQTGWHQTDVNKYLLKNYPRVTGKPLPSETPLPKDSQEYKENNRKTWFVPLSGKTLDIPFLLSLGYKVFGVECSRQAIEALDHENNLGLQFDEKLSLFVDGTGQLRIYFGDLFTCPIINFGPFDYVWDRGSFVAIEYSCRPAYKEVMQRALKGKDDKYYDFVYLLDGVRYDKTKFAGPPRTLDEEDLDAFYRDWTNVEFLESNEIPVDNRVAQMVGGKVVDVAYLVTPKV